jgi:hypothetical protein
MMTFWSNWWNEFGGGNRSIRRIPAPAPLCPPQNPTWRPGLEPRTAAVGSQWLNRLSYGAACSCLRGETISKRKNMVMGPDGDRNKERLCWRRPSLIYWTGLDRSVYCPTYITVSSHFKTPALFKAILTWISSRHESPVTVQHPKLTFWLTLVTHERILELVNDQETGDQDASQNEEERHELM